MNTSTDSRTTVAQRPSSFFGFLLVALFCLLAAAPLGGRYLYFLSILPHYEFAVVFLIGWCAIIMLRRRQYFSGSRRSSLFGSFLFVAAIGTLILGIAVGSSWFVYFAFFLGVGGFLFCYGNWENSYPIWPVWLALLVLLRPPFGYESTVLNDLRLLASIGASRQADLLRIPHYLEGSTFHLADKDMFMDDACSGIISLFTCMACASILAICRNRGVVHFLLLIAAGAFWAVIFNIFRILGLLSTWHWFAIDLTTGWRHDLIGYVALTIGVLFILISDIALNWVLQDTGTSSGPITRAWNRLIANPSTFATASASSTPTEPKGKGARISLKPTQILICITLTGAMIYQIPRELKRLQEASQTAKIAPKFDVQPAPLPENIRDWRHSPESDSVGIWRLGHEIKSSQAAYKKGNLTMVVAVAYPYDHWHDISRCYSLSNWKIDSKTVPADSVPGLKRTPIIDSIVQLEMQRDQLSNATVLFAFVDPSGQPISAPRRAAGVTGAIRQRFGFDQESHPNFKGFLVQVLWLRESGAPLEPLELQEHISTFEDILVHVTNTWVKNRQ